MEIVIKIECESGKELLQHLKVIQNQVKSKITAIKLHRAKVKKPLRETDNRKK